MRKYIIGSRGSDLALWQTNFVRAALEQNHPEIELEIKIIKTTGDQMVDVSLSKIGDKGLFTKQIETALLAGEIDLAVHSLKDLQTVLPENLQIGAILEREQPHDALVSKKYKSLDDLPPGGRVATGSLRRRAQLLIYRPDLEVFDIRGNVPTRLKKYAESDLDGMILAYAGLHRLNLDEYVADMIPTEFMLPAVGQGAMAVEIRGEDNELKELLAPLNDASTVFCVTSERAFLRRLEGGCQVPIAANAVVYYDTIHLEGMIASLDGKTVLRDTLSAARKDADWLGTTLAETMLAKGGGEILEKARADSERAANERAGENLL